MSPVASRTASWRDWLDPVLTGALALGLALRVASLAHGLPYVYNPDETSILSRALALASGDPNPHNFLYPSLYFYVIAACVGGLALVSTAVGAVGSLAQFEARFWQDPTAVYLVGRSISVLAGVLTVAAVYRLATRVGDRTSARVAAILMAVAYIPVRDAHFLKHDVPATLLIVMAVLASWRVWQRGSARDYMLAGASVGVAFAFHYPAALAAAALLAAHALRARAGSGGWFGGRAWAAVLAGAAAFAVCSPYVLLDHATAWRDIQANRAIIVGRAQQAFGLFGSALPQLELLRTQGAGMAWLAAAAAGAWALARASGASLVWLASFPVAFALFISNTWPFGRTANPLYPFLAVLGGLGVAWIGRRAGRWAPWAVAGLTVLTAAEPLALSWRFDALMGQTDTRTLAMQWIESRVPAGAGVAVEPYSVQVPATRAQLLAALEAAGIKPEHAGRRSRTMLARNPYPAPAYRLYYIGERGMDEDKIYLAPASFARRAGWTGPSGVCLDAIVLKRAAPRGDNPLSRLVARYARKTHEESPFVDPADEAGIGFLADFDVRPSSAVTRPGPVLEIWQTAASCAAGRPGP